MTEPTYTLTYVNRTSRQRRVILADVTYEEAVQALGARRPGNPWRGKAKIAERLNFDRQGWFEIEAHD
jgi:hypothetical protein